MSILEKQLTAHRLKHGLPEKPTSKRKPPPSILFSPQEAQWHDAAAFAALGRHGVAEASTLDPDIAASAVLFEGQPRDRETLTKKQNEEINRDIRHLLRLLSPHLLTRGAQECIDALLNRYHAYRWNVDDLLACALPYHDSPLFTRLLQALQIEGKPQWAWLSPLKEKPATLVRSALAKYCGKDLSVLNFIGGMVQETLKLHKTNRALATFFVSVWLDTLAAVKVVTPDLVEAAMPTLLAALRKPNLRDTFHAALAIVAALCLKTELEASAHAQILERAAKQLGSAQGQPSVELLALLLQLQAVDGLPDRALRSLVDAGPQAIVGTLPASVDCGNLLTSVVEGCLFRAATCGDEAESQPLQDLVDGLFSDNTLVDCYATPLSCAALQAFCRVLHQGPAGKARRRAVAVHKAPLAALSRRQPMAVSAAFRRAADATARGDLPMEPLVELLEATHGGAVASAPGSAGSKEAMMPLVEALMHGSPEARKVAIGRAVQDLKASAGQEDDAPRQRFIAGLVLQSVEEDDAEVVQASLSLKILWSELPQVHPASAVRVLETVLSRRLKDLPGSGSSLKEMFLHAVQDARTIKLLPPVLRCFAWVYGRSECGATLRGRIDAALLPLVILCLMGLDLALPTSDQEQELSDKLTGLRTAVLEFCAASRHPLLARLQAAGAVGSGSASSSAGSGSLGSLGRAVVQAADAAALSGLCSLVEAKPWPACPPAEGEEREDISAAALPPMLGILGGAAAQAAAAALLAAGAPRVLGALGTSAEAEQLAVRCSEACQCFAWHQSLAKAGEGNCVETLCQLLKALLSGICSLEALHQESAKGAAGVPEGRRRRKSGASGSAASSTAVAGFPSFRPAAEGLLRLVLERPRLLGAELRSNLSSQLPLLRPALLRLALCTEPRGPGGGSRQGVPSASAASANALLMVRSLLLSENAQDWTPDQSLLVPLVARLASADASEVRAAGMEVLKTLQGIEAAGTGCWDSSSAGALRRAGVLRAAAEVLPTQAWSTAEEQQLELAGLAPKTFSSVLEQLLAHRAEIVQDCSGAALALSKLLAGKGIAGKASRTKASAFWGVGLSMLSQDVQPSVLLPAIPAASLLSGLAVPLQASSAEAVDSLQSGTQAEAPVALRMAAVRVLGVARHHAEHAPAAGGSEKTGASGEKAASAFLQEVAVPFSDGLANFLQEGGKLSSDSMAELAELFCKGFASVAAWPTTADEWKAEVVKTLFKLCIAASTPSGSPVADVGEAEGDAVATPGPVAKVLAAASAALADVPFDAGLLRQILTDFPLFKGKQMETPTGSIAAELLCKQVTGLKGGAAGLGSGGGELLNALAVLASEASVRCSKRIAKAGGAIEGGVAGSLSGIVEQLLLAVAALSEHLLGLHSTSDVDQGEEVASLLASVCGNISEVPKSLGKNMSAGMLLAMVRACGALAALVPAAKDILAKPLGAQQPAPFACCIEALSSYAQPLRPDVLGSFKAHLQALWRCPEVPGDAEPKLLVQWDSQAQARLRLLLHTIVLEKQALIEQVDADLCLSLAESAGAGASMDFVILVYLARRGPAVAAAALARRKPKKRRAGEQDAFAEELLAEVLPAQDDDTLADEALEMLTSLPAYTRCQSLATLSQTLSALTLSLCQPAEVVARGLPLAWGPSLLPEAFVQCLDAQRASWVLDVGLQVASRFVSEHGLPHNLDEAVFSTDSIRATAIIAEDQSELEVVALSVCYVVWSVCMTEVLLSKAGIAEESSLQACKKGAKQLRSLLMRSLAVNHPVTFFRSICLAIRIPECCPAPLKGDLFGEKDFMVSEAQCVMVAAREALQDRDTLRKQAVRADVKDKESQEACLAHCKVAMRHTCQSFLADDSGAWSEGLALVSWRFLDSLCCFGGKGAAQPVGELCVPAAARCLARYAEGKKSGPSLEVAVESCSYLETAINELGEGLLQCLNVIANPLLDCATGREAGGSQEKGRALEERALRTAAALVKSLGQFLSPFLQRLLSLTSARAPPWKTDLLEDLARQLVATVPHRLLLPAVHQAVTTASERWSSIGEDLDGAIKDFEIGLMRMQRLAAIMWWTLTQARSEDHGDGMAASFLRLLAAGGAAAGAFLRAGGAPEELPERVFQRGVLAKSGGKDSIGVRWTEGCSKPSALRLNEVVAAAIAKYASHLTADAVKHIVSKVLEWARNAQAHTLERQAGRKGSGEVGLIEDTEDACRMMALCASMQGLVGEVPLIVEHVLLPMATKDLAAGLGAARRCALQLAAQLQPAAKKRRRSGLGGGRRTAAEVLGGHTWWWFEVGTAILDFLSVGLRAALLKSEGPVRLEEAIEALIEPCANMLDICEFLPGTEESDLSAAMFKAIQSTLVALGGACDSAHMKRLLTAILAKTRSDDVEVRVCSVRCIHKIWIELGVQAASGLSEVVMMAAELLEDEESRVEVAVRLLIKTMEECTGESLQDQLKH